MGNSKNSRRRKRNDSKIAKETWKKRKFVDEIVIEEDVENGRSITCCQTDFGGKINAFPVRIPPAPAQPSLLEPTSFVASMSLPHDLVKMTELHSKSCEDCNLQLTKHNYWKRQLVYECLGCGTQFYPSTVEQEQNGMSEQEIIVWGAACAGSHYEMIKSLYAASNLQFPFRNHDQFIAVQKKVLSQMKKAVDIILSNNAREELNLAIAAGETVEHDGEMYGRIAVVGDGSWNKRSYKHSYDAAGGVAVLIGFKTGKLLHVGTKIKTCTFCSRHTNDEETPEHNCQKNWNHSSLAMEAQIIVEGFLESMEKHKLIYEYFIGDGDSSTYAKIVSHVHYPGITVKKLECLNHAIKNLNKGIISLVDSKDKEYKDDSKFIARFQSRLGRDARAAIVYNAQHRNDATNPTTWNDLMSDVLNTPFHVFGSHSECKSYYCKYKSNPELEPDENLIPLLENKPIWAALKEHFLTLSKKSERLIWAVTSNLAEQFMSIVCKFIGGKRMNTTQKYIYNISIYSSVFSHQFTSFWLPQVAKVLEFPESTGTWISREQEVGKKLEKQRKYAAKHKSAPSLPKNIRKSSKNNYKDYAPSGSLQQPQDVSVDAEMLLELQDRHMHSLQITEEQQQQFELKSRGQRDNPFWQVVKRHRISASNCGAIYTLRDSTNNSVTLEKIIYPSFNNDLAPNDPRYIGIKREPEAIKKYMETTGNEVTEAGAFVSLLHPQFVVSPDGWIGVDGMVEVKCPTVPHLQIPLRKSSKFLIFKDKEQTEVKLNRKHAYFYQVVMQLAVTQRKYCDFIVYWREAEDISNFDLFTERVLLEEAMKVWEGESGMKSRLLRFYEEDCVPEIVDSMKLKHQPIRQPPYRQKAILEAKAKSQAKTTNASNSTTQASTKSKKRRTPTTLTSAEVDSSQADCPSPVPNFTMSSQISNSNYGTPTQHSISPHDTPTPIPYSNFEPPPQSPHFNTQSPLSLSRANSSYASPLSISQSTLQNPPTPIPIPSNPNIATSYFIETSNDLLHFGNGVEYANHSCYVDSTIALLFMGCNAFDSLLVPHSSDSSITTTVKQQFTSIVTSLRTHNRVGFLRIQNLRNTLYTNNILNIKILRDFMDLEEFLVPTLAMGLNASSFIQTDDFVYGDMVYFYNLFEPSSTLPTPIETCLFEQMQSFNIFLAKVPSPAFCILLPKSNTLSTSHILPTPTLNLKRLVRSELGSCQEDMTLSSVVIYDSTACHYTCLVKDSQGWLYTDSKKNHVKRIPEMASYLEALKINAGSGHILLPSPSLQLSLLLKNAYMLVYV